MGKRFTDTDKWKKGFLRSLPTAYKVFWLYLCDECSNCGIWETSEIDVAMLRTGENFDGKTALSLFNADEVRVHEFDNGKKWFIPSFVLFQYGDDFCDKASKNRLIAMVYSVLEKLKLLDLIPVRYPLERVARQGQGHGQGKKEGGVGEGKGTGGKFDQFWEAYPARDGKKVEKEATRKLFLKLSESDQDLALVATRNYANSGRMPKDPKRFLQADFWRDWIEPPTAGGFRTDRRPGASPAAVRKDPELYECFVCKARVPEADRRSHMEAHDKDRFKAGPIRLEVGGVA